MINKNPHDYDKTERTTKRIKEGNDQGNDHKKIAKKPIPGFRMRTDKKMESRLLREVHQRTPLLERYLQDVPYLVDPQLVL